MLLTSPACRRHQVSVAEGSLPPQSPVPTWPGTRLGMRYNKGTVWPAPCCAIPTLTPRQWHPNLGKGTAVLCKLKGIVSALGSLGRIGPSTSCRGFLSARLAGTQTWYRSPGAKVLSDPVGPSWWLWAASSLGLPGGVCRLQGKGFQVGQRPPQRPRGRRVRW